MKSRSPAALLLVFSLFCYCQNDPLFVPDGMEDRVQFWEKVFTEYSVEQRIIHDSDYPERIYHVIDFREMSDRDFRSASARNKAVNDAISDVKAVLKKLVSVRDTTRLNADERRIRRMFDDKAKARDFYQAMGCIHAQKGAVENFKEGLIRSGRYVPAMKAIFKEEQLPEDLVYLAHVESSFYPTAKSPAGAVGVWQFMKSTGTRYLTINSLMDERRDPILSTRAAARLLKHNFEDTGNWPLAITAYNHGVNGIRRAIKKARSRDLDKIIHRYESESFGYASKNFYAEFLAARHIAENPGMYFPGIQCEPPMQFKLVTLPFAFTIKEAAALFHVTQEILAELNPAFNDAITGNGKKIPKGYLLRVPVETEAVGANMVSTAVGVSITGF
ncbi:lytic transglycosylase domain-containing protein [bacterium]|nr:lytic transglycosylase domain-containing protein [bacterium]